MKKRLIYRIAESKWYGIFIIAIGTLTALIWVIATILKSTGV